MGDSSLRMQAKLLFEELAARGLRRVILLGSEQDMASGLDTWVARRGVQVLLPPPQERPWFDLLLAKAQRGEVGDEDRDCLAQLLEGGLEHGVDAIVVLEAALMQVVERAAPGVACVAGWEHATRRAEARIATVVFDMGGVLLRWEPLKMARAACESDEDAKLLAKAVFGSQEWAWQDAGAVSEDTVAFAARLALPKRLHDAAERLVYHWHDARDFIPQTGDLIRELKDAGYGIYLLSNAGESFAAYKDQLPAIECFDGMVVSCYEHVVKPDARIYRILCDRYGLDPATCLFVDDTPKNVEAARCLGMDAWRFDGDVEALRGYLLD